MIEIRVWNRGVKLADLILEIENLGLVLGIRIQNCDRNWESILGIGFGIGIWGRDWRFGIRNYIGDWHWHLELVFGILIADSH